MKQLTACFCVHCRSQVRLNDEMYVGYNPDCICSKGLAKGDVRFFSLSAKHLKNSFGFVLEDNPALNSDNSLITYDQATARFGRFTIRG